MHMPRVALSAGEEQVGTCGCKLVRLSDGLHMQDCTIHAAAQDIKRALELLADWTMRDGTPCYCPAGMDEDEPKGKMPTLHSTSCNVARAAYARATGERP